MFGSPLLGTAVGLVLLFATTALFCSGITETLSNILELRAKYLLTGMRALLDAPETEADRGAPKGGNVLAAVRAAIRAAQQARAAEQVPAEQGRTADGAAAAEGTPEGPETRTAGRSRAVDAGKDTFQQERADTLHERVKYSWVTRRAANELRARLTGGAAPSVPVEEQGQSPPAPPPAPRVPRREEVTTALWNSPLLRSLQSRRVGFLRKGTLRNPQYVSSRTFARALVDLLVPTGAGGELTIEKIEAAVQGLPEPLRGQLRMFLARTGENVAAFEREIEQWYDEQMAKIAGWYKRWSRVVLGIVGFAVAVLANIDTVQVAHSLYVDAPVQQAVVATADAGTLCQGEADPGLRRTCATKELENLRASGLTFGYPAACPLPGPSVHLASCWAWTEGTPRHTWDFPLKLLGWLVTAFAVSFGAPFWFEALSKLGSLRSAGTKPASTT